MIHFLNDVINFDGSSIQSVTFLAANLTPEIFEHKTCTVDIFCEDEKGILQEATTMTEAENNPLCFHK